MGKQYSTLSQDQIREQLDILWGEYNSFKEMGLKLDMSRGKPCPEQLDLTNGLYDTLKDGYFSEAGTDTRNYGELTGIIEMKRIFASMLNVKPENVICTGSSSLNAMYDTVSRAMTHGVARSERPWGACENVKFLCPVPGYDRHFTVTKHFGIEMINVPMTEYGPVMDVVEELVKNDDTIKGMWCVPCYANPNGAIYSSEVIARLAQMKCAAPDFTILWDNAYGVHHLYSEVPEMISILDECEKAGNGERVILFTSTSKVTFSGAGVSCVAGSEETLNAMKKSMTAQIISHNKVDMLVHARFLKDAEGVAKHMEKHADILRPKFAIVQSIFSENLDELGIASWTKPLGGYFVNLVTPKNTAARIVALCKDANVVLTPAGAAFPYGKDPDDNNIRIAPTFPSEEELAQAAQLLCVCVRIAALEQRVEN